MCFGISAIQVHSLSDPDQNVMEVFQGSTDICSGLWLSLALFLFLRSGNGMKTNLFYVYQEFSSIFVFIYLFFINNVLA